MRLVFNISKACSSTAAIISAWLVALLVDSSNLLLDRVLASEHVIDLSQVISPWEKSVRIASWSIALLEMSTLTEVAHLHV